MDGENEISYFVLMIPVWVAIIPFFAYIIINGLAAQNTRINSFEKVILSSIVPLGFSISLFLLIWNVEEGSWEETGPKRKILKFVFVPHLFSLLSLYLYLRCLVRPVKIHNLPDRPNP